MTMKHGWLNVRMRGAAVSAMALTVVSRTYRHN